MRRLALVILFAGCNGGVDTSDTSDPGTCNTDNEACGVDQNCGGEGDNMLPGSDCIACHDGSDREAPEWTAAGTVYDDLYGSNAVQGATVRITDDDGAVIELVTGSAGNFRTSRSITAPYVAEVEVDGEIVAMAAHQDSGACNSCHQCEGAAGGKLHTP